jgi:hypothetical protein
MAWSPITPELGGTTEPSRSIFCIGKLESGIGGSFSVTGKWPWIPLSADFVEKVAGSDRFVVILSS